MERLTRPNVLVEPAAGEYIVGEVKMQDIGEKFMHLILNGPTLNGVNKDILRHLIRQMYDELKEYEDTGVDPEKLLAAIATMRLQYANGKGLMKSIYGEILSLLGINPEV